MPGKRALQVACLLIVCAATTAFAQLRLDSRNPIVLRNGAGTAAFAIVNVGLAASPVALRMSAFTDDTSQTALPMPRVSFSLQAGGPVPTFLLPGSRLNVEVNVSGMSGTGVASATLFNGNAELGRLPVVAADAPLDISILGAGEPGQQLAMTNGANAEITLKNNDAIAYPLDWSFQLAGRVMQSGELQLAPQGTSRIELLPTDDLYSWTDYVRPSGKTGQLVLSIHGPPEVPQDILPQRTLPISLRMQRLDPGWTSFWSHLFVVFLLLIGGLLSVMGSAVLPNILRKVQLRRGVSDLTERINSVSTRVDPYLRTLLRVERKRIVLLLKRTWPITPSSSEMLDNASTAIDRLHKRLKAAERLDEMRRRLEEGMQTAPPSVTDDIDGRLHVVAGHLHALALPDDEVAAANGILDEEGKSFAKLGDSDALARMLAGNFRDLKVRQKFLPYSYYNDLKIAVPGLFELLNQPFDDFRNIPKQMIFAVDYGISAIQMVFDYAILRASTPASAMVAATGEGSAQSARDRLVAHQKELIQLLGTLSWQSLHGLRALLQEMRENIYPQDVLREIGTPGQAKIVFDPRTVRAYVPILFSIRFKDPRFNDAAAIHGLACKWEFPKEMLDQDWKACHFFKGNEFDRDEGRHATVSVRVESQQLVDAAPAGKDSAKTLRNSLSTTIDVLRPERPSYSRAFAETVRFLIAFGVALAGLLSGALQQIEKLDFVPAAIAILALGFGVDTIKNLLVQTSRKVSG